MTQKAENSESAGGATGAAPGLRVGFVGAGYISDYHAAAVRRLKGVELVGVCDVDAAKAEGQARRLGTRAFASPEALRDAGAGVLHVLTPPHTHADLAVRALEAGCHVLVEKPLAVEVADCERVAAAASAAGRKACVNHSLLFDPQVRKAIDAVRAGKVGKVVSVDFIRSSLYPPFAGGPLPPQYRTAGYPFRDLGVHALYLFEALLGPIVKVQADWDSLGGDRDLAYDEWRAQVHCRDGMGQFQLSWNVRPLQSQLIIQGTRGVMRVDLFLMFQATRKALPLPKPAERIVNAITDSLKPMVDVPRGVWGFLRKKILPYHGLQDLVAAFYKSIRTDAPVPVSVEDAKRVVYWTEHVARAADEDHRHAVESLAAARREKVDVLVTGAGGGVGSAVVARLLREGKRVRVFVRRPPRHVPAGVEVALGNLGDPDAVSHAVRGAGVVIHAGAAMKGGWVEHQCATVTGTANVVRACLEHGVSKLVHVSSMSVLDWAGGPGMSPLDEASPLEPRAEERGSYTRAKLEAENVVVAAVRGQGLRAVVLRPGQIFGGGAPLVTGAVARRAGKRWLVLGDGQIPLPLIHIDDVVDAVVAAAAGDLAGGEVIQLVAPDSPTQDEVLGLALPPGSRVVHVPRWFVFTAGWASQKVLRLLKRQSPIAPYRLRSALSKRTFRSAVAGTLLGWRAKVDVRAAARAGAAAGFRPRATAADASGHDARPTPAQDSFGGSGPAASARGALAEAS